MRKTRINQLIRDNSVFQTGTVTAVNADGTYSICVKGRGSSYTKVIDNDGGKYSIGDSVMLSRAEGDSQKPSICGYGPFGGESAIREVER